jgi:hypothetical protein
MQNLSYVVIKYYGNTAATAATITSSNLVSGSYTSPDLSLNTLYTFTLTPYSTAGSTGNIKTLYIDTSPSIAGVYVVNSTSSSVQLQWYGSYSYVAISQSVNGGAYVDLSAVVVSMPYTVSDVSGNTALSYKVTPYYSGVGGTASSTISVTTNTQAPRDVSAVYVDSSGALISFTAPKNTYSSSAVYTVRRTDPSGNTADVSGTTSPLWIQNLSAGTMYSVVAKTTLDGSASLVSSSSTVIFTTLSAPPLITGYTTYVTNGSRTIYIYAPTVAADSSTVINNAVVFSGSLNMQILAIGGGGSGGGTYQGGGGGGAGTLIQGNVSLTSSDNISITIGGGGSSSVGNGKSGVNTLVTFNSNVSNNIIAYSGGGGATQGGGWPTVTNGFRGGSLWGGGIGNGGVGGTQSDAENGTGGVGGIGSVTSLSWLVGSTLAAYYWGGGGGGSAYPYNHGGGGAGGNGGGGGGTCGLLGTVIGVGGSGYNSGSNGIKNMGSNTGKGGNGGANTGGGGGGGGGDGGGIGGSGIVLIII